MANLQEPESKLVWHDKDQGWNCNSWKDRLRVTDLSLEGEIPNHGRVQHSACFSDPEDWDGPSGIEMLKRRTGKGECDESASRRLLRCVALLGGNMNMRRPYDGDAFSKGRNQCV